ncbi:MAG TPA: hypothetical protein VFA71_02800 [Terriglobales bacterium]|nr:hypothetical protein [Terriglobales bacterium]
MREIDKFESGSSDSLDPEDRLAGVLRRLGQEAPRSAPPEVGAALGNAFRRHHRRRRIRNTAIAAMVVIGLSSAAWLLTKTSPKAGPQMAVHDPASTSPVENATTASVPGTHEINVPTAQHARRVVKHGMRHGASHPQASQLDARQEGGFLPLPAYDPEVAQSELRIVRVEMPIQDLRLVGAPVSAAVPNRRVLADFVVGQDGTPYGVRLVQ